MNKKIGIHMSLCMAISLSFALSLMGNLMSGHFSAPGFLLSFAVSTVLSLLIGVLFPMPKLQGFVCRKTGWEQRSGKVHAVVSLLSDLVYSPVITLCNVTLAFRSAEKHGAGFPFLPMFLRSFAISLIVAYVLIFLLTPLFIKIILKENGISPQDREE